MKKILLIAISTLLLMSCSKKNTTEVLPTPTGSLTGRVVLNNSQGAVVENAAGVTVSLDSTSYNTTTDSLGNYTLKNIPQGIYTITYNKSGYSIHKMIDVTIDAGNAPIVASYVNLYEPSSVQITSFSAKLDSPNVNVSVTINPPSSNSSFAYYAPTVLVFMSTSPSVSSVNYISTYNIDFQYGNGNSISEDISSYYLNYPSGSKIYLIAYPNSYNEDSYLNPATGRTVYEGLGTPSSVVPVTLP